MFGLSKFDMYGNVTANMHALTSQNDVALQREFSLNHQWVSLCDSVTMAVKSNFSIITDWHNNLMNSVIVEQGLRNILSTTSLHVLYMTNSTMQASGVVYMSISCNV